MGPKNSAVLNRGTPSKELSWFDRMNLKLEALIDVDPIVSPSLLVQHTSQYVESSVGSVGSTMRKLCGDIMRDLLLPPFTLEGVETQECRTETPPPVEREGEMQREREPREAKSPQLPAGPRLGGAAPSSEGRQAGTVEFGRKKKKSPPLKAVRIKSGELDLQGRLTDCGANQEVKEAPQALVSAAGENSAGSSGGIQVAVTVTQLLDEAAGNIVVEKERHAELVGAREEVAEWQRSAGEVVKEAVDVTVEGEETLGQDGEQIKVDEEATVERDLAGRQGGVSLKGNPVPAIGGAGDSGESERGRERNVTQEQTETVHLNEPVQVPTATLMGASSENSANGKKGEEVEVRKAAEPESIAPLWQVENIATAKAMPEDLARGLQCDEDDESDLPEIGQDSWGPEGGIARETSAVLESSESSVCELAEGAEAHAWWYVTADYRRNWGSGHNSSMIFFPTESSTNKAGETDWDWELL